MAGAALGGLWAGSWAAAYGRAAALCGGLVGMFAGLVVAFMFDAASDALDRATTRWPRWAIATVGAIEAIFLLSLGVVILRSSAILLRHALLTR